MTINFLIILSSVVVLLVLWVVVGVRHLKSLRAEIGQEWELTMDSLRKRQDLLPNLVETIRVYDKNQEAIIEELIAERINAAKEYFPGAKKFEYEHTLSSVIGKLIDLGSGNSELGMDTNFLELKKEISDISANIQVKSRQYNEMVRYYNRHINLFLLRPIALVFHFEVLDIFEFEG